MGMNDFFCKKPVRFQSDEYIRFEKGKDSDPLAMVEETIENSDSFECVLSNGRTSADTRPGISGLRAALLPAETLRSGMARRGWLR